MKRIPIWPSQTEKRKAKRRDQNRLFKMLSRDLGTRFDNLTLAQRERFLSRMLHLEEIH